MFSWRKKREPVQSQEVKEMEAMIAAMTSTSLTSFANGEGEDVDDEASLEVELAALMGITTSTKSHRKIVSQIEGDPENVQLDTEDENNPELLEELASLSPHSVDLHEEGEHESVLKEEVEAVNMTESMGTNVVVTEDLEYNQGAEHEEESTVPDLEGNHSKQERAAIEEKEIETSKTVAGDESNPIESFTSKGKESVPIMQETIINNNNIALEMEKQNLIDLDTTSTMKQEVIESAKDKQIAAARMLALKYKKAGDLEAAKDVLKMMRQLEAGQKVNPYPIPKKSSSPEESMTMKSDQKMIIDRQIAIQRLQEQASKAHRASKLYELQNHSTLSQVFKQRTKTILEELDQLKKSTETKVQMSEVPVSYDIATPSIKEVKPDELYLGITQIKAEGFGDESCWSFQCTLDTQEKVTSIGALNSKTYHDVIFTGLNRDLKLTKFFEHRKLKIELLKHESGLFGSLLGRRGVGQPVGVTAQIKLDTLLKEPSIIETVSFNCKNKRNTLQADLSLKVNTPIGSKVTQRIKEMWITMRTDKEEETMTRKASLPGTLPGAIPIEELVSYSVLEEEISRLASLPLQTRSHPAVLARQLQLESAKDVLALKVEIGELSQEDYAKSISEAILKFKKQAIAAKKAGDLPLAKAYLGYSKVMEKELTEEDDE